MLVHIIGADDVIVSLVELLLVRPCQVSAISSTEFEVVHPRNPFWDAKAPESEGENVHHFWHVSNISHANQRDGSTYPEVCCQIRRYECLNVTV